MPVVLLVHAHPAKSEQQHPLQSITVTVLLSPLLYRLTPHIVGHFCHRHFSTPTEGGGCGDAMPGGHAFFFLRWVPPLFNYLLSPASPVHHLLPHCPFPIPVYVLLLGGPLLAFCTLAYPQRDTRSPQGRRG